ncbi:MAG: ABC transporter substrate-binding protein [Chloroflexales bacterium]|nr:ABC transporter substrate-binding protein [Chloroflexales bacterium]
MRSLSRTIGLGFIALCLLSVALKAFVPLPSALGYAPVDLGFGAKAQPVEVVIWYGTEKKLWLEEAVRLFEAGGATAGGRPIIIKLVGLGSREIADRVARQDWGDDPRPAVVSPASSVWTEVLRSDWAARASGAAIFSGDPTPLVLTPLVAVAWDERASLIWPNGSAAFWQDLSAAIATEGGWAEIAKGRGFQPGSPEHTKAQGWGFVKFGHTSPLTSNSGTQTLAMLAYAYHNKTTGLTTADIADPAFQSWLEVVERSTLDFGESTGTLMTNMIQFGPSRFDVVMVYENLAIEGVEAAQRRWGQPIHIYYPPATILSDHPYAILGDPLTTADQRAAAERFHDFLLSEPIQTLALQYGFRPASPRVTLTGAGAANPFSKLAQYGLQVDIAQQVETPSDEVTRALIELWERRIAPLTLRQR